MEYSIRQITIPGGACTGKDREVFEQLDAGNDDARLIPLAQAACRQCIQLPYCYEQRQEIASSFWFQGIGTTYIGGERVSAIPDPQRTEDAQLLKFDLSRLPSEPELRLHFIRQGMRAKQLNPNIITPRGIPAITDRYLASISEEQRDSIYQAFDKKSTRSVIARIAITLCQAADFKRFSQGANGWAATGRYHLDSFDFKENARCIDLFVSDALLLNEEYRNPVTLALFHSPEYLQRLKQEFTPLMSESQYTEILVRSAGAPRIALERTRSHVESIQTMAAKAGVEIPNSLAFELAEKVDPQHLDFEAIRRLSVKYPDVKHASIIRSALTPNPESYIAERSKQDIADALLLEYGPEHPYIRASVVRQFQGTSSDLAEICKKHVANMELLTSTDPGLPKHLAERIAIASPNNVFARYTTYKECLVALENSGVQATANQLKTLAFSGITDAETAAATIAAGQMRCRYLVRAGRTQRLHFWFFDKIARTFPDTQTMREAGEQFYQALEQQILVPSKVKVHGSKNPIHLTSIISAKGGNIITFHPALRAFAPEDRLAHAQITGLGRLLYGQDIALPAELISDPVRYGAQLTANMLSVIEQYEDPIVDPVSIVELEQDLAYYEQLSQAPRTATDMQSTMRTVVGGSLIRTQEQGATQAPSQDIVALAAKYYPPHLQEEGAARIEKALAEGFIALTEAGVTLAPRISQTTTPIQAAILAHAYGVDRVTHGGDIGPSLHHRFGGANVALLLYAIRSFIPNIEVVEPRNTEVLNFLATRYGPHTHREAIIEWFGEHCHSKPSAANNADAQAMPLEVKRRFLARVQGGFQQYANQTKRKGPGMVLCKATFGDSGSGQEATPLWSILMKKNRGNDVSPEMLASHFQAELSHFAQWLIQWS